MVALPKLGYYEDSFRSLLRMKSQMLLNGNEPASGGQDDGRYYDCEKKAGENIAYKKGKYSTANRSRSPVNVPSTHTEHLQRLLQAPVDVVFWITYFCHYYWF